MTTDDKKNKEKQQTDALVRPSQPGTLSDNISGGRRASGLHLLQLELQFSAKKQKNNPNQQTEIVTGLIVFKHCYSIWPKVIFTHQVKF